MSSSPCASVSANKLPYVIKACALSLSLTGASLHFLWTPVRPGCAAAPTMRPPKTPSPSRLQVIIGQNTPWTRDLRHVTAVIPRLWNKSRQTWLEPKFKDVKPKERIKWWNIVPGDSVRVLGDPDGLVQQVHAINKFSNRVFLKRQNVSRVAVRGRFGRLTFGIGRATS